MLLSQQGFYCMKRCGKDWKNKKSLAYKNAGLLLCDGFLLELRGFQDLPAFVIHFVIVPMDQLGDRDDLIAFFFQTF